MIKQQNRILTMELNENLSKYKSEHQATMSKLGQCKGVFPSENGVSSKAN